MNDEREGNPYESPRHVGSTPPARPNPAGRVGFALSLLGVIGVVMVCSAEPLHRLIGPLSVAIWMSGFFVSFFSLPGLLVSGVGLFRVPRRLAAWGCILGFLGAMNLPTFLTAFLVHVH